MTAILLNLRPQVVPSDDLEEAEGEEAASPSLLNDELRQEMRARQAKMHRYTLVVSFMLNAVKTPGRPEHLSAAPTHLPLT